MTDNGTNVLSVTKADAGTWVLSGNNTYTGLTTLSAGTLTLSGNNSGTGGVTLTAGTLNINSATALGATASAFNINGGTIDNTSGTAKTLANNNPITLGGSFAYGTSAGTASNNLNLGTGTVSIGGSRIITLNGAGALTFGGVLANTAAAGMSVTVNKGTGTTSTSSLNLGGISITASGDATARNFTLTGDGNINVTGGIVNGAGTGAGALIKSGTGILTLTGANAYTGTTSINAGVLDAIDGTGLPTGSALQLRGGVFQSSGTFTRTVANGIFNWGGSSGGFAARGGLLDLKLNNGTSSLTWGNSYTNIAGESSSLVFGSATADNRVDFKNGLNLGTNAVATRTINVIDNPNSSADIARISGNITETTAGMGLLKDGAGTLELTGNNTYTGATTISAGTLQIGAGGTSGAISSTSGISNNGTLAINRSDALTVSTIISGTGALRKNGAGTLALTGNNTYTGGTTVSTGTLMVNNTSGSGTGSGSLLVSAGATLGGSGEIAGITTISGILAPGNSIGTLTVANDVTWDGSLLSDGTANWKFELGAANTADLLRITGGASEFLKGSGSVFCFDFLGSTETGTFTLVDWDSTAFVGGGFVGTSFAATDFTYTNLGNSNTGTFQFNGSQLQFQSIPEPSPGVLMVIAGTALFVLRRRRMQ
jgi:autotransporter-associated beta strand protein